MAAAATAETDPVKIILLDGRWAGKSSSGNTILNKEVFGSDQQTEVCVKETNKIAGMQVTVVDTPSWNWVPAEASSDEFKQELKHGVEMLGEGPRAFLLVYPLGATFLKRHKIAVEEHMELLGADVWDHTMLLFSRGDWLGEVSIEQHVEGAKAEFKWLLDQWIPLPRPPRQPSRCFGMPRRLRLPTAVTRLGDEYMNSRYRVTGLDRQPSQLVPSPDSAPLWITLSRWSLLFFLEFAFFIGLLQHALFLSIVITRTSTLLHFSINSFH
ncbi:GTPase IMAP family member 4 isoform X3 [Silurus asotus]|uniref:GTPase IMAP family member 4 isoform X3 n=1 Tax=Silurus asotus TaxID=30991 RepID=A0AAD5FVF4_SILAS|nr:GTPase IMAP family member 4 isoform X3 [Silurus asotus]